MNRTFWIGLCLVFAGVLAGVYFGKIAVSRDQTNMLLNTIDLVEAQAQAGLDAERRDRDEKPLAQFEIEQSRHRSAELSGYVLKTQGLRKRVRSGIDQAALKDAEKQIWDIESTLEGRYGKREEWDNIRFYLDLVESRNKESPR